MEDVVDAPPPAKMAKPKGGNQGGNSAVPKVGNRPIFAGGHACWKCLFTTLRERRKIGFFEISMAYVMGCIFYGFYLLVL